MELTPKPPTKRLSRYTKRLLDQSLLLYEAAIRISDAESNRQMVSASDYFNDRYESMPLKAFSGTPPLTDAECQLVSACAELLESIHEACVADGHCLVHDLALTVRAYSRESGFRSRLHTLLGVT